jgi:hypothetical protein
MNCKEIQEQLFAAESLSGDSVPPELAAHLHGCAACAALRVKLVRLEAAARSLPVLADSSDAKEDLLRQLQTRPALPALSLSKGSLSKGRRPDRTLDESPLRLLMRRGWQAKAVAAAVLVVLGGTIWVALTRDARQVARTTEPVMPTTGPVTRAAQAGDPSVVDKLVDMNLDLADAATPAERNEIFAEQAAPLTATLQQDHLAPEDKELASKLLENGKWLSSNTDPFDEAERFDNVAGLLFDQLQQAAPAGDTKVLARLTRRYGLVAARLDDARAKLAKVPARSPEQKRRYERLVRRQTEVEKQLQELLQRAPEMSRKEIRKELESIGKGGKKKGPNGK